MGAIEWRVRLQQQQKQQQRQPADVRIGFCDARHGTTQRSGATGIECLGFYYDSAPHVIATPLTMTLTLCVGVGRLFGEGIIIARTSDVGYPFIRLLAVEQ